MKVSIGILAYNESAIIETTLQSLFKQSLFQFSKSDMAIEIVVVPNGCTDNTADVARVNLTKWINDSSLTQVSCKVCEIEQAGLANAWNQYIHTFSDPEADYLIVMSADIKFLDSQTLHSMIQLLETRPEAWVSVDKRIKDITLKKKKSLIERLSIAVSELSGSNPVEGGPAWISGQLSCTRAKVLRQVWLPTTLPTDDAFLYVMITTDRLTSSKNINRVLLAPSASHSFEAYLDLGRLLRHEKWLIFGQAINEILYADLLEYTNQQQSVGNLIKQRNDQNPLWLNQLITKKVKQGGWWLIPRFILIRRFQSLRYKSILRAILLFPLATLAFMIDLLLAVQANWELHREFSSSYWLGSGSWGKKT